MHFFSLIYTFFFSFFCILTDRQISRGLNDRVYDKRKAAALELEKVIRECVSEGNHQRITAIITQLRNEYAYAVHQPNARYGGLIGLAAVAIALGQNEFPKYLELIMHPVLACFGDQDSVVRYFACEALYNIAKVAKGEILIYFNEIFDVLCKLVADVDIGVKNGADILDRLIKDITSEKAVTYVSILYRPQEDAPNKIVDSRGKTLQVYDPQIPKAFSLQKFIPLLKERMYASNPYTRMFLVSWLRLLDSIPDLELVSYLPAFLQPLLSYLSSSNHDVKVVTASFLGLLLQEIKRIYEIKKYVSNEKKRLSIRKHELNDELNSNANNDEKDMRESTDNLNDNNNNNNNNNIDDGHDNNEDIDRNSEGINGKRIFSEMNHMPINDDSHDYSDGGIYIPGQDTIIDYPKIIDILIASLDSSEESIQLVALQWLEALLDISPESFILFMPKLLSVLLQTISHSNPDLKNKANEVNNKLIELVSTSNLDTHFQGELEAKFSPNYSSIVNQLTLQFLNEKESTRLAALDWLIMLHDKNPQRFLEQSDSTFVTLLKALNDPSDAVINKDLELLSKLSNESDDNYFQSFMEDLLKLFRKDRKLLATKADFIIRTVCASLNAERIYMSLAKALESETNLNFVSLMVQILNNNLITAPELSTLRKKLSNKADWPIFQALFKSWCYNPPAALSLCLLAERHALAFSLVESLAEFEISVGILVQIDILVQLLESPVFSKLRMKLLNPSENPYLYKCLFGILMLLPQSSAFEILKNRLASVTPIASLPISVENGSTSKIDAKNRERYDELLEHFNNIQKTHEDYKYQQPPNTTMMSNIHEGINNITKRMSFNINNDINSNNGMPLETSSAISFSRN